MTYNVRRCCYICDEDGTEKHHVFGGNGRREKSDKHGLKVYLCHEHHNGGLSSVHQNYMMGLKLKCIFQMEFESRHSKKEFIAEFGKDYIAVAMALGKLNPMLKEFKDLEQPHRTKNPWIRE